MAGQDFNSPLAGDSALPRRPGRPSPHFDWADTTSDTKRHDHGAQVRLRARRDPDRGDRLHVRLVAEDVTHGFYLEGYDLDAKARPQNPTFWLRHPSASGDAHAEGEYQEVQEIDFVAARAGKFHYRCSITCGSMHPFMQGELIVSPNSLYSASVGLSLALAAGMLIVLRRSAGGRRE